MGIQNHIVALEEAARREAQFVTIGTIPNGPKLNVGFWRDLPHAGSITGFTIGLSVHRPLRSGDSAPELLLSMDSTHLEWVLAMGEAARQAANGVMFTVGDTIDFKDRMSPDSEMSAFLVYEQMVLPERFDVLHTDMGHIVLRQLIPIYHDEMSYMRQHGIAEFADAAPEVANPRRAPVKLRRRTP